MRGGSPRPINNYLTDDSDGINWIKIGDIKKGEKYVVKTKQKINKLGIFKTRLVRKGDFILSNSMSFGRPYILKIDGAIHDGWLLIKINNKNKLNPSFLYEILRNKLIQEQYKNLAIGGVVLNLNSKIVKNVYIPLPPFDIQKQIATEIEIEQKAVDGLKLLIEKMEKKISNKIEEVWKTDSKN